MLGHLAMRIESLITHRLPLHDLEEGFQLIEERKSEAIKVLFTSFE